MKGQTRGHTHMAAHCVIPFIAEKAQLQGQRTGCMVATGWELGAGGVTVDLKQQKGQLQG